MIITYKFYSRYANWRCAAFGEYKDGRVNIIVIPCNPKDQFSKKKAKELLGTPGATKHSYVVVCEEKDSKKAFFKFMKSNYRKVQTISIPGEVLEVKKKINKMVVTSTEVTFLK